MRRLDISSDTVRWLYIAYSHSDRQSLMASGCHIQRLTTSRHSDICCEHLASRATYCSLIESAEHNTAPLYRPNAWRVPPTRTYPFRRHCQSVLYRHIPTDGLMSARVLRMIGWTLCAWDVTLWPIAWRLEVQNTDCVS